MFIVPETWRQSSAAFATGFLKISRLNSSTKSAPVLTRLSRFEAASESSWVFLRMHEVARSSFLVTCFAFGPLEKSEEPVSSPGTEINAPRAVRADGREVSCSVGRIQITENSSNVTRDLWSLEDNIYRTLFSNISKYKFYSQATHGELSWTLTWSELPYSHCW